MLTYLYSFNILENHHPDLLKYVFLLIATFISYSIIKYVLRLILYIKKCIVLIRKKASYLNVLLV